MKRSKIKGLKEWQRNIDKIPTEVANEVNEHVQKIGYKIEADAKRLVPVDTGHLRRSIKTEIDKTKKFYQAEIGTNVKYAVHVEFGTSRQAPHSFLTPSYVKWKPKYLKGLEKILKKGVGD